METKTNIDTALYILKIVAEKDTSWKRVSQSGRTREGTIYTTAFSNFRNRMMRPHCQTSTTLQFMKPKYESEKLIRTIIMIIFVEHTPGSYIRIVGK